MLSAFDTLLIKHLHLTKNKNYKTSYAWAWFIRFPLYITKVAFTIKCYYRQAVSFIYDYYGFRKLHWYFKNCQNFWHIGTALCMRWYERCRRNRWTVDAPLLITRSRFYHSSFIVRPTANVPLIPLAWVMCEV